MHAPPWVPRPALDLSLDLPWPARLATVPPAVIADGRRLLEYARELVPRRAMWLAHPLSWRLRRAVRQEARAFARWIDADWRLVLLSNLAYELGTMPFGCSSVALATPKGPVLARNMDWGPADLLAQTSWLIRFHRERRPAWMQAGWPGAIGAVTGMSSRGFAVAINAVAQYRTIWRGRPVLLLLRQVLEEAADFDAAVAWLSEARLMAGALLLVVGIQNEQRVVIERSAQRCETRWARGDRPLFVTNHYRKLRSASAWAGEEYCPRYEGLQRLLGECSERNCDDRELLYALSDPSVQQEITAQHVILRPAQGEASLHVPRRLLQPQGDGRTGAQFL